MRLPIFLIACALCEDVAANSDNIKAACMVAFVFFVMDVIELIKY